MERRQRSAEFTVAFGSGGGDVLVRADHMIAEARRWAAHADWIADMGR